MRIEFRMPARKTTRKSGSAQGGTTRGGGMGGRMSHIGSGAAKSDGADSQRGVRGGGRAGVEPGASGGKRKRS